MTAPVKIAAFAGLLALVFAAAALAGDALDPAPQRADEGAHGEASASSGGDEQASSGGHQAAASGADGGASAGGHEAAPSPVRGLAVADDGLRLVVRDAELRPGRREALRFAIVDESGAPVRDFDVAHEKRMHLIVVRRDLTGFQHLHPEQAADGTWSAPVTLPDAGSYRVFADFTRDGEAHTLASDLRADGPAELAPLPAPATTATTDGYAVRLDARGERLRFEITRAGEPVRTQPYLGAGGHLVALRDGDLAFLHVHPEDGGVAFETTFPSAGRYRLFLQFKHAGEVHTAAFTVVAP